MSKNNVLKEWRYFTIFNHEAEEKYLRERANQGWILEDIKWLTQYNFRRAEPRDRIYRLDYRKHNLRNDGEERGEYLQLYEDFGWHHQLHFMGFDYFWTEDPEAGEDIFSDRESRINMLERVYTSRLLLIIGLFFVLLMPQLIEAFRALADPAAHADVAIAGPLLMAAVYIIFAIILAAKLILLRNERDRD